MLKKRIIKGKTYYELFDNGDGSCDGSKKGGNPVSCEMYVSEVSGCQMDHQGENCKHKYVLPADKKSATTEFVRWRLTKGLK